MKNTLSLKFLLVVFAAQTVASFNVMAQTEQPTPKNVNFAYSKNPKTKTKKVNQEANTIVPPVNSESDNTISQTDNQTTEISEFESRSLAKNTSEVVKKLDTSNLSPTEIYKIGVGDVLFISLQNAPSKASTYYTVLNDGKIDCALAGEMISVNGLTTDEVEDLLKEKIKIYENPQISVKIREHASHTITVLGLVEKAGEKYLQREAIPLFIVKAEAIVQSKANLVTIKRANSETETVDLKDSKADDVLIFPGDIVEFKSVETENVDKNAPQFYFIGGNIMSAGQKDFHQGLTLTQAILASGGLKNKKINKVVLRRKNQNGLLSPIEFDLNLIKDGKQPDPILQAGDTIEISK